MTNSSKNITNSTLYSLLNESSSTNLCFNVQKKINDCNLSSSRGDNDNSSYDSSQNYSLNTTTNTKG